MNLQTPIPLDDMRYIVQLERQLAALRQDFEFLLALYDAAIEALEREQDGE